MKRLLAIALVAAAAFALTGCEKKQESAAQRGEAELVSGSEMIRVGIVNLHPSESGYREANVKDMDKVFNAANGYDVLKANYNTLNEQLDAARQFINSDVDYLLISAADENGWDDVLQTAYDAGITVFLFDRMINCDPSLFEAAVISDMENQGRNAVAWLIDQELPEYNIIHIQGQIGSAAQRGRSGPLAEAIAANDNWNLVRRGTGGDAWSPDAAKQIVEAAIAAGDNFNIIYAENDGMAEGAMQALRAAGRTHGVNGDVMIMGFDFNKYALRYVMAGDWNFNGQCSPFQADVIHGFIQQIESEGSLNLTDKIVINPEIIADATNVDEAFIEQYGLGD